MSVLEKIAKKVEETIRSETHADLRELLLKSVQERHRKSLAMVLVGAPVTEQLVSRQGLILLKVTEKLESARLEDVPFEYWRDINMNRRSEELVRAIAAFDKDVAEVEQLFRDAREQTTFRVDHLESALGREEVFDKIVEIVVNNYRTLGKYPASTRP